MVEFVFGRPIVVRPRRSLKTQGIYKFVPTKLGSCSAMTEALDTADTRYPEQWGRLLRDPAMTKWAWGHWRPSLTVMHGWHTEDFEKEISTLHNRLAYWLGRCPTGKTDGFNEVRCCWVKKKIEFLEEQKNSCNWEKAAPEFQEKVSSLPREDPIKPMPVNPYRGQNAFITKREREEQEDGSGETNIQFGSVELPSPTALPPPSLASRKQYVPPRKRLRRENEQKEEGLECSEVFVPPTPPLFESVILSDDELSN